MSAPAYGDHDLQRIAVLDQRVVVLPLGDDLAVSLDRDLASGHRELLEQLAHVDRPVETVRLAVHGHLDHKANDTRGACCAGPPEVRGL